MDTEGKKNECFIHKFLSKFKNTGNNVRNFVANKHLTNI